MNNHKEGLDKMADIANKVAESVAGISWILSVLTVIYVVSRLLRILTEVIMVILL